MTLHTTINREDAFQILELGKRMHEESGYRKVAFNPQKLWDLLDNTLKFPERRFIAYEKRDGVIVGGFLGQINEHYFSDELVATDLAMYVVPELRKSRVFYRMFKEFEAWAKAGGATSIFLGHTTGVDTEKAKPLFEKLGYQTIGYVFNKEI